MERSSKPLGVRSVGDQAVEDCPFLSRERGLQISCRTSPWPGFT